MNDGLVDKYLDLLNNSTNPGATLTAFLFEVHEQEFNASLIPTISKLRKLYGTMNVFYSICETAFVEEFVLDKSCVRLISYFCLKRASKDTNAQDVDLKAQIKKRPTRKSKLKPPDPFKEKLDE